MITLRRAADRGHSNHGWLDSRHTFSFAEYHDPAHMGFQSLRVINEDRVEGGQGFATHPHRDMEIISYVLEGALAHRDSLGTGSIIQAGEFQRMSAGTGVTHSEYNASPSRLVHFLQMWVVPAKRGIPPSYEQRFFPAEEKKNRLRCVVAPDGADGALTIHQDVSLYVGGLDASAGVRHLLRPGRHAWVQVTRGAVTANGERMEVGDGAAVTGESEITLRAGGHPAEVLVFDLASP